MKSLKKPSIEVGKAKKTYVSVLARIYSILYYTILRSLVIGQGQDP